MESKIIKQESNSFLEREEIVLEIKNNITPTYDEVKTEIGEPAELVVIKKINTNFGRQTFVVEAVVYDNIEALKKIETIPQKVRKKMEADKKTADEAAKKAEAEAAKADEEAKKAEEEVKVVEETPEKPKAEEISETIAPEAEASVEETEKAQEKVEEPKVEEKVEND